VTIRRLIIFDFGANSIGVSPPPGLAEHEPIPSQVWSILAARQEIFLSPGLFGDVGQNAQLRPASIGADQNVWLIGLEATRVRISRGPKPVANRHVWHV